MKPSERIIQIVKDMAREEAKSRDGYCCACDYDILNLKEAK